MRILDKYILKELFGPFIFGVAAFSSIFIGSGTLYPDRTVYHSIWRWYRYCRQTIRL